MTRTVTATMALVVLFLSSALAQTPVVARDSVNGSDHGWAQPIASALVPGLGQVAAGRDRGAVYLVAEVFLWSRFLASSGEGGREKDRYRDLALEVARASFSPARRDTTFDYFEKMEQYVESGVFDTDPGPALVPPTDDRTYNGSVWRLARQTFFEAPDIVPDTASPQYARALEFYVEHAVGPNFQWSWRNAGLEQDLYRQSIKNSDAAFKRATQYLGLILANHLISAVDAFVSYRLSTRDRAVQLHSGIWRQAGRRSGLRGEVGLRVWF